MEGASFLFCQWRCGCLFLHQDRAWQHRLERQLVPGPCDCDRHETASPPLLLQLQQLAEQGGGWPPVVSRPVGQLQPHGHAQRSVRRLACPPSLPACIGLTQASALFWAAPSPLATSSCWLGPRGSPSFSLGPSQEHVLGAHGSGRCRRPWSRDGGMGAALSVPCDFNSSCWCVCIYGAFPLSSKAVSPVFLFPSFSSDAQGRWVPARGAWWMWIAIYSFQSSIVLPPTPPDFMRSKTTYFKYISGPNP